jgi:hypothetical protein
MFRRAVPPSVTFGLSGDSALRRQRDLNGEIFYTLKETQVWPNGGGSTTTPSDRTHRWDTGLGPEPSIRYCAAWSGAVG